MWQWAVIVSSGRLVRVERHGRLLLVISSRPMWDSVSTCRYDERFYLLPRSFRRRGYVDQRPMLEE